MDIALFDKGQIYTPDYNSPDVPELVKKLKPVVFADNTEKTSFCCILGEDPQSGILGCGNSPREAMLDWEQHYRETPVRRS